MVLNSGPSVVLDNWDSQPKGSSTVPGDLRLNSAESKLDSADAYFMTAVLFSMLQPKLLKIAKMYIFLVCNGYDIHLNPTRCTFRWTALIGFCLPSFKIHCNAENVPRGNKT